MHRVEHLAAAHGEQPAERGEHEHGRLACERAPCRKEALLTPVVELVLAERLADHLEVGGRERLGAAWLRGRGGGGP
eukprot:scaffold142019_cov21-Tisochrysis_lutea.AAC.2